MIKVYIAGKITGLANYKELFNEKEHELKTMGYTVMNPSILPYPGFNHDEYMHICKAMIDVCDWVYFLDNWHESQGASIEMSYAFEKRKVIWFSVLTKEVVNRLLAESGTIDWGIKTC